MTAFVKGSIAASAALLASISIVLEASAQAAEGTKFRGVALNQSIEEVQKVVASNGFEPQLLNDRVLWVRTTDKKRICGDVYFKDRRAVELRFSPCFFRLDGRINSRDFAQQMVENYPIPKLDTGTRQKVDGAQTFFEAYYYGRLTTGETVEVVISDSPQVVVTPGSNAGGPVFK